MLVQTVRGQIRNVAQRWRRQYRNEKGDILAALQALDVETALSQDVALIIGNDSWTDLRCYECGLNGRAAVVQIGEEPDYDSSTAWVCQSCLEKALSALHAEIDNQRKLEQK